MISSALQICTHCVKQTIQACCLMEQQRYTFPVLSIAELVINTVTQYVSLKLCEASNSIAPIPLTLNQIGRISSQITPAALSLYWAV